MQIYIPKREKFKHDKTTTTYIVHTTSVTNFMALLIQWIVFPTLLILLLKWNQKKVQLRINVSNFFSTKGVQLSKSIDSTRTSLEHWYCSFFVLLEKVQCPKSKQSSKMRFCLFRFGPSYLLVLVLPVINFGRNHVSLKGSGFASQCGNFTILLLLRFNVKSIWAFLEVQNKPL